MADNKRHWDNKRGRGWQRILEGPDKGHWEYYDNWAPTGKIDRSGAKDALPNLVKGAQNTLSWLAENKNKEQIAQSREGKKQIQTGRGSRWVDDPDAETRQPVPTVDNKEISQLDLVQQTDQRAQETTQQNPWMNAVQQQGTLISQGGPGGTVTVGGPDHEIVAAELRREKAKQFFQLENEINQRAKAAAHGGQEYTTSFREAFRNANKTQVYEDTMDREGGPLAKSNVFTIDPDTGLPLGVMGRSQRRAWDEANAERLDKAKAEAEKKTGEKRVEDWVKNEGDFKKENTSTEIKTEPNVGSEIENTGEGGEIFTPPTPLSEDYKNSLFNPPRA